MVKVLTVVGARPQFVKAAVVSRAMHSRCLSVIVHTGQHYDYEMSESFFVGLEIPDPTYNLAIGSAAHGRQTGEMLIHLEEVLLAEEPDLVLLYGDTNSTLAGALAAAKLCLPIAHVEAGARNSSLGIPEEINRIVADRLSALLFCATQTCVTNLERESIREGVFFTGDVLLDLHLALSETARATSTILEELALTSGHYVLATIHRPQNTDVPERLKAIFEAFIALGEPLVLPLHPRTVKELQLAGLYDAVATAPHIQLIKPLSYIDFLRLKLDARLVITDSGGVQKEAYFCQRPCVTIFPNTAWVETVEDGWNIVVNADREEILQAARTFRPAQSQRGVFGDGHAGDRIVDLILDYLAHPRPIYKIV